MQTRSAAERSRAELEARESGAVLVDIYDQIYSLRGTDAAYLQRLADVVDDKMRVVAAYGSTVDSLRVAVLAALNIADELAVMKARYEALQHEQATQAAQNSIRTRAGSLAGMLDDILAERKAS